MASHPDSGSIRTRQSSQGGNVIRDLLENLEAHARGMWRYRWRAVIVMWLVSIAGWVVVYAMPPVYQANARIYVDTENALRPLLRGIATSSNVMDEVVIVIREMLGRTNLTEVIRNTDLYLRAETDAAFDALLASLQQRISVRGNRDNIYSISFQDPDRDVAVAVVDSLVNTFVESSLGADRTDSGRARTFLQQEINDYEARLTTAEDRLANFKRQNVALMLGQRGDYFSRLQSAEVALGRGSGTGCDAKRVTPGPGAPRGVAAATGGRGAGFRHHAVDAGRSGRRWRLCRGQNP